MAVIQPSDVRESLPSLAATAEESRLATYIERADAVLARYCGFGGGFGVALPTFASTSYTAYQKGPGGAALQLTRWPIVSVTTIEDDPTEAFDGASYLVASADYRIHKHEGLVELLQSSTWGGWSKTDRAKVIKAVYVAGYASGTLPADIKHALCLQVVDWMNTAPMFGLQATSGGGAAFSPKDHGPSAIHPEVRALLSVHRTLEVLV